MRAILALLLGFAALGCQLSTAPSDLNPSLDAAGSSSIFTTDRETYAAGETVLLRLRNPFEHALGYNLCGSLLEQQINGTWRVAEFGGERVCTAELRLLQPGNSDTYRLRLSSKLPQGTYRFTTSVENMKTGARERIASNLFLLTR